MLNMTNIAGESDLEDCNFIAEFAGGQPVADINCCSVAGDFIEHAVASCLCNGIQSCVNSPHLLDSMMYDLTDGVFFMPGKESKMSLRQTAVVVAICL